MNPAPACPSLSRIVAARDGGLCRIKLPGGVISAHQAQALSRISERHASGIVDITNRANLQIRGVRAGAEDALVEALLAADLGPAARPTGQTGRRDDASAPRHRWQIADDVRNVMINPTSGLDPQALTDVRPLADVLLAWLQGDDDLSRLSPKFSIFIDGGERLAALDHPHDIWLSAMPGAGNERWFAVGFAGTPPTATPAHPHDADHAEPSPPSAPALAAVRAADVVRFVTAAVGVFLDEAALEQTRLRHLLETQSANAFLAKIHARAVGPTPRDVPGRTAIALRQDDAVRQWRRRPADTWLRFGVQGETGPERCYVGAQPAVGRLNGGQLGELAALACRYGEGALRMTPWQGLLIAGVARLEADRVLSRLDALGLVHTPLDARASMIACAGSTGCARAAADTKTDALALAAKLEAAVAGAVHLSGCERSCALAATASHTLLAIAPGRYDLYRRDDTERARECTGDPARRFGHRLARDLSIDDTALTLTRLERCERSL